MDIIFYNYNNVKINTDNTDYLTLIENHFSYFDKKMIFTWAYKKNKNIATVRLFNRTNKLLKIGLLKELISLLQSNGIEYRVDNRIKEYVCPVMDQDMVVDYLKNIQVFNDKNQQITPHSYQYRAVLQSTKKPYNLLISPTSSGKSLIMYLMIRTYLEYLNPSKILLVVPNCDLIKQLGQEFKDYSRNDIDFIAENEVLEYVTKKGDKNDYSKKIHIMNYQGIKDKPASFFDDYELVIFDESHKSSNNSSQKIIVKCTNAKYKCGFTGTVPSEKIQLNKVKSVFGDPYIVTTLEELMEREQVADVRIQPIIFNYDLVKPIMPYTYQQEKDIVKRHAYNRNMFLLQIAKDQDKNVLYLCNDLANYGNDLYEQAKAIYPNKNVYLINGDTSKEMKELRSNIRGILESSENNIVIATYSLLSTGWSVKNIHKLIFAQPLRKYETIFQSLGRLLRLHKSKKYGIIYDVVDKFKYKNIFVGQYKDRLGYYKRDKLIVREEINFNI
jgi:superfamily II DNA or RNA helicase